MAESLYSVKDPSKTKHKPISSTSSLAFSSNLAALISSSSGRKPSTSTSAARTRPSKSSKSDIFTSHNKNVKKRSAADMEQSHQTKDDLGAVSAAELQRSKRKMEDKVRMYNAMKRGEYIGREDYDERGLVDFDRKWAESRPDTVEDEHEDSDSESEDSRSPQTNNNEMVSYTDEFGRLRTGTAVEARRFARQQRIAAAATVESANSAAHPQQPANIIYGDTIQHQAFNPDQIIADKMSELAAKRDKSATPPPDTHYDANHEIRTRGTGFYGFSKDEELRKKEMESLEKERAETERAREVRQEAKDERKQEIEERRKVLEEKRSQKEAGRFLNSLELEIG
jgi:Domain of unknown function (DUF4078)